MSSEYVKLLNALPRPDLYDSFELVKRHMPVEQPPSAASYIVFQKGGQCYAKNGMTGHIEFGPGDAGTVIQSAINALTNGGKIFIKDGTYTLNSPLTVRANVGLVGEGKNTVLYYPSQTPNINVVTLSGDYSFIDNLAVKATRGWAPAYFALVKPQGNFTKVINCYLSDSPYDGIIPMNGKNILIANNVIEGMDDDGINPSSASDHITIANNLIKNTIGSGIHLARNPGSLYATVVGNVISNAGNDGGISIYNSSDITIIGNVITDSVHGIAFLYGTCENISIIGNKINATTYGITASVGNNIAIIGNQITAGAYGVNLYASNILIKGNMFTGGTRGVYTNANNVSVIGNQVRNVTEYGIVLSGGTSYNYGEVIGNLVDASVSQASIFLYMNYVRVAENIALNAAVYSINEAGGDNNVIEYNTVDKPISKVGVNTVVRGNKGFVTENSGTAVGTGSQQTISHGCNFTPSKAQVILSNIDNGANPYLSANPDATNIYVTAVNGKTYRWEVKMYP
jgi:hypothetical protein